VPTLRGLIGPEDGGRCPPYADSHPPPTPTPAPENLVPACCEKAEPHLDRYSLFVGKFPKNQENV
jgi:hypothetical protein